jgi:hypothetical protein
MKPDFLTTENAKSTEKKRGGEREQRKAYDREFIFIGELPEVWGLWDGRSGDFYGDAPGCADRQRLRVHELL